jgi:hypothetical protein
MICATDNCPWGNGDDCCRDLCVGDNSCCSVLQGGDTCRIGEGDCDADTECVGTAVCGTDNCPWDATDDCCISL